MHKCKSKIGKQQNASSFAKTSWLSALFIILLPKCPFCVMAYSGAVTLCSGKMYVNADSGSVYFILGLSLIILFGIGLNFKGKRTIYSLLLASTGILFLMMSQMYWYSETIYYSSVLLILIAIWNNGSMHSFINKFSKTHS